MHLCPNAGAEPLSWAIFFFLKIKLLATKSDQQREKCRHCKERSIDEHKIPFLLESEWLLPHPRCSVFSLRLLLLSEIFLFVRTETFLLVIVSPASGRPPGRADPSETLTEQMRIRRRIYIKKLNVNLNYSIKTLIYMSHIGQFLICLLWFCYSGSSCDSSPPRHR